MHVTASTLDDRVKRAVDSLGDRLREEITRELRMDATSTRILDAVRALDEAGSLSAVLDTLVARASAEASRANLFLLRADRLRAWRDDARVDMALSETDIVALAVRTQRAASTLATGSMLPPFGNAPAGAELHAFPLSLSGDVVAVLYTEGGDATTLEVLARHAARVLESLTAFKTAHALAAPASPAGSLDVSAA